MPFYAPLSQVRSDDMNAIFKPYGDGSDGDHTVVGTETLTRDTFYNSLTVPVGTVIDTAGFRLFVKDTLTVNGTIRRNGNNASGATFGQGLSGAGTLAGSTAGGAGQTGAGSAGTSGTGGIQLGGAGGAGGQGQVGNAGGAGGTVNLSTSSGEPRTPPQAITLLSSLATRYEGGAGGGGGGGGGGGSGGGAGGGGGIVAVYAQVIAGTGTIQANGGNGANGVAGNSGGGGGGGGGAVVIVTNTIAVGVTRQANGGAAGAAIGTGVAGVAGAAGRVYVV